MAYILSIETATPACSVALHQNDQLLGSFSLFIDKSHASQLTLLIQHLTAHCALPIQQIDAVAVSKGPGSYTGLRIGVSTAKGLCYALDIPFISVNTLEAMALQVQPYNINGALLCPMLDARRMEVYCGIWDQQLQVQVATQAKVIDEEAFRETLDQHPILFFGNGAQKCKAILSHHPNAFFLEEVSPQARTIGQRAVVKYEEKQFEELAYFEPYYLKDFVGTKAKK
ncbi:MAG: tRNA (adenosine(37)-N6)-threonylcarbamoyltransferase complex dimerization subunit type 1 TsaB [Thermonemataceae bacterium]